MANGYNDKFDPDKKDLLKIAVRLQGHISQIAKHYGISNATIYEYFHRDPEGRKIIDRVRKINTETELDAAEFLFRFHMSNYKENPNLSLRAAEKVIDKKGHLRGWVQNTSQHLPKDDQIDVENNQMDENHRLRLENAVLKVKLDNISKTGSELCGSDPQV